MLSVFVFSLWKCHCQKLQWSPVNKSDLVSWAFASLCIIGLIIILTNILGLLWRIKWGSASKELIVSALRFQSWNLLRLALWPTLWCVCECTMGTWKEYLFYSCSVACSLNVSEVKVVDRCCLDSLCLYWFFSLAILSVVERGLLKSSMIVNLFLPLSLSAFNFPFKSVNFCFIYFEALLLGAYTFMIVYLPNVLTVFSSWNVSL